MLRLVEEHDSRVGKLLTICTQSGVTHRQGVVAERLIIQLVFAQVQCVQVVHTRERLWLNDSDVVLFKNKSHGIIQDEVEVHDVSS